MTLTAVVQRLTEALFLGLFLMVLAQAVRRPRRVTIHAALFFGAATALIPLTWLVAAGALPRPAWLPLLQGCALMLLPVLMLRLTDDMLGVSKGLLRAVEVATAAAVVALVLVPAPLPPPLILALVGLFVGVEVYTAARFVGAARMTTGLTKRRMQAVAAGTLALGLIVLLAGAAAFWPAAANEVAMLNSLLGLGCGLALLAGFVPPNWLRRAWRERPTQDWLARIVHKTAQLDTPALVRDLEQDAARAPHPRVR